MVKIDLTDKERQMLLNITRNTCTICNHQGFLTTLDNDNDPVFEDCQCVKTFAKYARYLKAGVHRRYWDWTPTDILPEDEFRTRNAQQIDTLVAYGQQIEKFIQDGTSIFLWGPVGTGKTALASWLLKQALDIQTEPGILDFKYTGGFVTLRELVNLLVEAQTDASRKAIVDFIEEVDLLFIDEFDKEYATGTKERFSGVAFGDLFNSFYNRRKAIIVVSNMSLLELKESGRHTEDVLDRLNGFDEKIEVELTISYRSRNK